MSRTSVGVTGHRVAGMDEADPALLLPAVDGVLELLWGLGYRVIVSGLAEGADRIVAERALAEGWVLDAMLPFSPDRYERDFATHDSRAEFRRLLARARAVSGPASKADVESPYLTQGKQLVSACDALIALWDGEPPRGPGGTAEVVSVAEDAGVPVLWIQSRPPHPLRILGALPSAGGGPA